jgi:hypothetical protein
MCHQFKRARFPNSSGNKPQTCFPLSKCLCTLPDNPTAMSKPTLQVALILFAFGSFSTVKAQNCEATMIFVLENIKGGFHPNQTVKLINKVDGKIYSQKSNARGEAQLVVPCMEMYDLNITNYVKRVELESPERGSSRYTFSYSATMVEDQKKLAMTKDEEAQLDQYFTALADTTVITGSIMPPPKTQPDYYAMFIISIKDIASKPLVNEEVILTGRRRNKSVKGTTDKNGRLISYLPKGDIYDVHFKYNKNYSSKDIEYTKGTTNVNSGYSYLGTKEIEKRRKEEEARIAAEEKRMKEEREAFEKSCQTLGLSLEDCYRKERERKIRELIQTSDTVVMEVLNRNNWTEKLIVCDVTGSMSEFAAQLLWWFKLNFNTEKNMQVVLFNDGDGKEDHLKKTGETGGVHYTKPPSFDSLANFMTHVQSLGYGGLLPENNMEALVKAVKMASPFKELIMVADNRSPVRDMELLSSFKTPVRIIVCGSADGYISPDYLKIAWKTKGSVHTMEQDFVNLARLSEGQSVVINGITYRIMGGEFVDVSVK